MVPSAALSLKGIFAAIACLAALAGCDGEAVADAAADSVATNGSLSPPSGNGFDFWVLSLSWSPSYCEAKGDDANRQQCASPGKHAFIVHGLWPQFERGWPEFCDSREPDRVPDRLVSEMLDIMPSAGLIGHQWRKHGSCSGLSQRDYFRGVRAARGRVEIPTALDSIDQRRMVEPDAVEEAFRDANPGLGADAIAVTCDGGLLREVRICMSKNFTFRACPEVDRRGCRHDETQMPASR
ncbi:MAG: ribonuclease [Rhizobiaceae bacterium]|nr:ribonuclease [Rhizobiaceae bacterium]MCV0406474.1 ribonuclease [Rhizobiaceae bacterium]